MQYLDNKIKSVKNEDSTLIDHFKIIMRDQQKVIK